MLMDHVEFQEVQLNRKVPKVIKNTRPMLWTHKFFIYCLPKHFFIFFSANLKCFISTDNVTVAQIVVEYFGNWLPEIKMEI